MDFGWPNAEIGRKNGQWSTIISSTGLSRDIGIAYLHDRAGTLASLPYKAEKSFLCPSV